MSEEINEEKLVDIDIDFTKIPEGTLNESWLRMFGSWTKTLLNAMFGGLSSPVKVRGTRAQVESYARALGGEKRYMEAVRKHGLDNRVTYTSKSKLDAAVRAFERETGITWPFK
jgi:hypothetical protein